MLHRKRVWQIRDVEAASLAVELLRCHSWTECTGFRAAGTLWLNDSFGADGAQEYAVIREADGHQIESITAIWCTVEQLQFLVDSCVARLDEMPPFSDWVLPPAALEHGEERCRHCA